MNYSENYADHYQSIHKGLCRTTYEHFSMRCIDAYLPDKEAPILDVGCGIGLFVYYLHRKGYLNAQGIDISASQVECARKIIDVPLRLTVADAHEYLADKPRCYKQIYLFDVLEHVPKDHLQNFLSRIISALEPGGSLVIRTPNMANPFGAYSRYLDITHEIGFSEHSLLQVMKTVGAKDHVIVNQNVGSPCLIRLYRVTRNAALRIIFKLEERTIPKIFDKNLLMIFYF